MLPVYTFSTDDAFPDVQADHSRGTDAYYQRCNANKTHVLLRLCMMHLFAWWTVFMDNGFWKSFWAYAVIFMTESGLFLMQCHHLGPKPHLLRTEIFPDLCASFEDNMYSMMIYEVSKFLHRETLFWNCSTIFRCCFRCWSLLNLSKMFFLCPIMWLTCLHLAEIVAKCSSSCFLKHYYTFPAFCFLISPMLQPSN